MRAPIEGSGGQNCGKSARGKAAHGLGAAIPFSAVNGSDDGPALIFTGDGGEPLSIRRRPM